jgi:hypothetical protein
VRRRADREKLGQAFHNAQQNGLKKFVQEASEAWQVREGSECAGISAQLTPVQCHRLKFFIPFEHERRGSVRKILLKKLMHQLCSLFAR